MSESLKVLLEKSFKKAPILVCLRCVEPGASKRKCCNAPYCDHCYISEQKCPNCDVPTKQEKLTGATYEVKVYSEHEECRACLEPGTKRKCCNNYYCDDCYYKLPHCRSCGTTIGRETKKGGANMLDRAKTISVIIGWGITLFIVALITGIVVVIAVSESLVPQGIFYNKCYGFFRTCDTYGFANNT